LSCRHDQKHPLSLTLQSIIYQDAPNMARAWRGYFSGGKD
jgi:hypothetical protein